MGHFTEDKGDEESGLLQNKAGSDGSYGVTSVAFGVPISQGAAEADGKSEDRRLHVSNQDTDWYGMLLESMLQQQRAELDSDVNTYRTTIDQTNDASDSGALCRKVLTCKLCMVGLSRSLYWGLLVLLIGLTIVDIMMKRYSGISGFALPFKICIMLPTFIGGFFAVLLVPTTDKACDPT